jgi:PAS domain-containing protein
VLNLDPSVLVLFAIVNLLAAALLARHLLAESAKAPRPRRPRAADGGEFIRDPSLPPGGPRPDRSGRDFLPPEYFEELAKVMPRENVAPRAPAAEKGPSLFRDLIRGTLARIKENTEHAYFAVDGEEKILCSNELANRLFGVTSGELMGRPLKDFLNLAADRDGSAHNHRATAQRADGTFFDVSLHFELLDPASRIVGIKIEHDYQQEPIKPAAEPKADASIVRSQPHARLGRPLDPGSIELNAQEMVNPMRAVMELAQMISKDSDNLTPTQKRYLQALQNRGNRFIHQIEDMELLIQIQDGSAVPEVKPFPLADLLQQMVAESKASLTRDGVDLTFINLCRRTFLVQSDVAYFQRLIRYLLNSALRATSEGTIVVELDSRVAPGEGLAGEDHGNLEWDIRRQIRISLRVPGNAYNPQAAEVLKGMTGAANSDDTRLQQAGGPGRDYRHPDVLGLTLAGSICELLGGKLSYRESGPGEGIFCFEAEVSCLQID